MENKPDTKQTKEELEKDYKEIMKGFEYSDNLNPTPQWSAPGDYIVKFSLYQETPNSITSTNTQLIS